jgi:hypothetical protein
MHDTLVVLKNGKRLCGPIWEWRPREGWLTLVEDGSTPSAEPIKIWFRDVASAVTTFPKNFVSTERDELARAGARLERRVNWRRWVRSDWWLLGCGLFQVLVTWAACIWAFETKPPSPPTLTCVALPTLASVQETPKPVSEPVHAPLDYGRGPWSRDRLRKELCLDDGFYLSHRDMCDAAR